MKKYCSILFLIAGFAGLLLASPLTFGIAVVGFAWSITDMKVANFHGHKHAYLTVVPAKMVAPNFATMKAQGQEEIPPMTRAEKALFDYLRSKSNAVTYDAIKSGAISFDPISYYIRYNITNLANRVKILGPNSLYSLGITNFPNGATLPQYYNFCFDRITVRYAVVTSASASPSATAGYSSVQSSMDPALRNGEIIISSNRNTIVETPIIDFASAAAITGGGLRENDGGILEKPRFLLEQLQVEIELNLAGQIPNTANNTFLAEVVLSGVQARLKY